MNISRNHADLIRSCHHGNARAGFLSAWLFTGVVFSASSLFYASGLGGWNDPFRVMFGIGLVACAFSIIGFMRLPSALKRWRNDALANDDLAALSKLLHEARECGFAKELPELPREDITQITNGELETWCSEAGPILRASERERLAAFSKS